MIVLIYYIFIRDYNYIEYLLNNHLLFSSMFQHVVDVTDAKDRSKGFGIIGAGKVFF